MLAGESERLVAVSQQWDPGLGSQHCWSSCAWLSDDFEKGRAGCRGLYYSWHARAVLTPLCCPFYFFSYSPKRVQAWGAALSPESSRPWKCRWGKLPKPRLGVRTVQDFWHKVPSSNLLSPGPGGPLQLLLGWEVIPTAEGRNGARTQPCTDSSSPCPWGLLLWERVPTELVVSGVTGHGAALYCWGTTATFFPKHTNLALSSQEKFWSMTPATSLSPCYSSQPPTSYLQQERQGARVAWRWPRPGGPSVPAAVQTAAGNSSASPAWRWHTECLLAGLQLRALLLSLLGTGPRALLRAAGTCKCQGPPKGLCFHSIPGMSAFFFFLPSFFLHLQGEEIGHHREVSVWRANLFLGGFSLIHTIAKYILGVHPNHGFSFFPWCSMGAQAHTHTHASVCIESWRPFLTLITLCLSSPAINPSPPCPLNHVPKWNH